jgi:hypothetical protein
MAPSIKTNPQQAIRFMSVSSSLKTHADTTGLVGKRQKTWWITVEKSPLHQQPVREYKRVYDSCRSPTFPVHTEAPLPPLASHGLRGLQPFRAGRKARKHEGGLHVLALVLRAWSLTERVQ